MNDLDTKQSMVWNCIFGENFTLRYIVPLLHEQKISKSNEIKNDPNLSNKEKVKNIALSNVRFEQHIKDIQLQYKQITRQFYDVARHRSVVSFVELGTDLYCSLSNILKKRVDFSEKVVKEKYTVALLEESENGTIFINGKKFIIHT